MTPCPHTYARPTRFTKINNAVVVRLQCDLCGALLGERPKAGINIGAIPEFDANKFAQWQQREQEAHRRERLQEAAGQDDEWWERYNAYLRTPHWDNVRRAVGRRDGICTVCFEAPPEQAHHLTYRSFNLFGMSFPCECTAVCTDCHERLHNQEVV